MPNPTSGWDRIPVFGFYFKGDDVTPTAGTVRLTVQQRVTRVDGRRIYSEGATVECRIGEVDPAGAVIRDAVRAAWRGADEAEADAAGQSFDGAAWDAWWNVMLTGAVFAGFPASDDPNIVQTGYDVKVEEKLVDSSGKVYFIRPLLAQLDQTPPGINLGLIEVPPGAPSAPAPVYAKGLPGGVAALDDDGDVVDAAGVKIGGGPSGPETELVAGDNVTLTPGPDGTLVIAAVGGGADGAAMHTARKEKVGGQTINAFAGTPITYEAVSYSHGDIIDTAPVNGLRATVAGLYVVGVETYLLGGSAGERNVTVLVDGVPTRESGLTAAGRLGSNSIIPLTAGAVVTTSVYVAANSVVVQSFEPKDTGLTLTYLGPLA